MTTVIEWKHIKDYQYEIYKLLRYYGVILDIRNYIMEFWENCITKPYFLDYKLLGNAFNIVDIDNTYTFKSEPIDVSNIKNITINQSYGYRMLEIQFNESNTLTNIISNITRHFDHNIVKSHLMKKYNLKYTYDYYDEKMFNYRFMLFNRKLEMSTQIKRNGIDVVGYSLHDITKHKFDERYMTFEQNRKYVGLGDQYKYLILNSKNVIFEFSIDHLQLSKGFFKNPYYVNFCVNVIEIVD